MRAREELALLARPKAFERALDRGLARPSRVWRGLVPHYGPETAAVIAAYMHLQLTGKPPERDE